MAKYPACSYDLDSATVHTPPPQLTAIADGLPPQLPTAQLPTAQLPTAQLPTVTSGRRNVDAMLEESLLHTWKIVTEGKTEEEKVGFYKILSNLMWNEANGAAAEDTEEVTKTCYVPQPAYPRHQPF
ncbi:uncharacterized protein [Bemisia tabaci]|uniref:uncharacterized protein isoform X3 n=1 Tax=Bemisia tabaci TaxID=7038 RepID=UPI0008F9D131|nr:PREDICTED: uncharacterized protein LOC109037037 isoform X2 [Bemisia tabaci]